MCLSITIAITIRKLLETRTRHMKGVKLIAYNSFSAFTACSLAGSLNAFTMRYTELKKGISLIHPDDPSIIIGTSKIAAQKAVMETTISRFMIVVPLTFPSIWLYMV